jgi:hypothetical protein
MLCVTFLFLGLLMRRCARNILYITMSILRGPPERGARGGRPKDGPEFVIFSIIIQTEPFCRIYLKVEDVD